MRKIEYMLVLGLNIYAMNISQRSCVVPRSKPDSTIRTHVRVKTDTVPRMRALAEQTR